MNSEHSAALKPHTSDFERNNQEIIENGTKFDKRILQTADGSDTEMQEYEDMKNLQSGIYFR